LYQQTIEQEVFFSSRSKRFAHCLTLSVLFSSLETVPFCTFR